MCGGVFPPAKSAGEGGEGGKKKLIFFKKKTNLKKEARRFQPAEFCK